MRIVEVIENAPFGALPRLYYSLNNSATFPSCHEELDLRHPFSIYSLSLSTIREKVEHLLTLVTPLYLDPKGLEKDREKSDAAIRDATDALLDALMEHFDDCSNVLKCYLDKRPEKQKKKIFSLVQSNWENYRNHIGTIVNRIKHKQRRVRTIVFYGDQWAVPGYFIEGPAGSKLLGPDPLIHAGGGTAFSFRRNLMFHLCGIYATSRSMSTGLALVDHSFANFKPNEDAACEAESRWLEILRSVESLSPQVFPDEAQKDNPIVKSKGSQLRIEYPSREKARPVPSTGTISTSFIIDGMSPSYRMPYFKTDDHA